MSLTTFYHFYRWVTGYGCRTFDVVEQFSNCLGARTVVGAAKRYTSLLLRKTTCIQLPRGFINSSVALRNQNAHFVTTR